MRGFGRGYIYHASLLLYYPPIPLFTRYHHARNSIFADAISVSRSTPVPPVIANQTMRTPSEYHERYSQQYHAGFGIYMYGMVHWKQPIKDPELSLVLEHWYRPMLSASELFAQRVMLRSAVGTALTSIGEVINPVSLNFPIPCRQLPSFLSSRIIYVHTNLLCSVIDSPRVIEIPSLKDLK